MMKKILSCFLCLYTAVIMQGCESFVDVDPPPNRLVTSTVFSSNETATAALMGIYGKMMENMLPFKIALYTGYSADELVNYSMTEGYRQLYVNGLTAVDAPTTEIWRALYNSIYQANALMEGCDASTALSDAVKRQLKAEAFFIRAFCHLYLVSLFGDVPFAGTTDYQANARLPRIPADEVLSKVIGDLQSSYADINAEYVAGDNLTVSTERIRPNKGAVSALLARANLYAKKYEDAAREATAVINNKVMYELPPLEGTFLKESREAVWQLMMPVPALERNTWEGAYFILAAPPSLYNSNCATLSPQLLSSFAGNDGRKDAWTGVFTDTEVSPPVDYSYPFKYKIMASPDVTEHSIVLRLAEQYLIRAEARANTGDLAGAVEDLDAIRTRAGLPSLLDSLPAPGKDALLNVIMEERKKELFVEWGHRWIDLVRTGRADAVMSVVTPEKGGAWNTNKRLWPIPLTELQNNPALVQNPGYN